MQQKIPAAFQKLLDTSRQKHVQKGQVILYVGDMTSEVYLLSIGVVKLYNVDEFGNEKVLHLLRPPFVMPFAFYSSPDVTARWYYKALTDCDLYVLQRETLERIMEGDPQTLHFLVHSFSEEVHEVLTRLDSLGKSDSSMKLMIALRYLALYHSEKRRGGWWRVLFPVNQQLLADMTGVSRETISAAMKALIDNQIVRYPHLTTVEVNFDHLNSYRQRNLKEKEAI